MPSRVDKRGVVGSMKLIRPLTIYIICLIPQQLLAITGNDLYSLCTTERALEEICAGYLTGALDVFPERTFCPPKGTTLSQIKDVVVIFLRDHPETRHQRAPDLVAAAIKAAFPCKQ
jgi:Rap1a immunity proteins